MKTLFIYTLTNKFKVVFVTIFISVLAVASLGFYAQKAFAQYAFTWKMENTFTKQVLEGGGATELACVGNRSTVTSGVITASNKAQWVDRKYCSPTATPPGTKVGDSNGSVKIGDDKGSVNVGQGNGKTGLQVTLTNPLKSGTLEEFVNTILAAILKFLIPVLAILFIYTGFKLVTSRGNEKALTAAKHDFFNLVIGAVLILGAYTFGTIIMNTLKEVGITN